MITNLRTKVLSGLLTAIVMAYQHSGPLFIARVDQMTSSLVTAAAQGQTDCAHAQAGLRQKSPQFVPAVFRTHPGTGGRSVSLTLSC